MSLVADRLATFQPDGEEDNQEDHGARTVPEAPEEIFGTFAPDVSTNVPDDRHNDPDLNAGSSGQAQSISARRAGAARTPSLLGAETQDFEQSPDDRRRPQRLSRMRPPGTAGLPDPWVRLRAKDISLGVSKDANLPDYYIAALIALIAEIKKTGAGQRRYEVENGTRVDAPSGDTVYVFPFTDEADLFEDAMVEVAVPGRRVEGSVVSIAPGRLVLAVKEDLGPVLRKAIVLIDATALLEALKEKIDQIKSGQLTINRVLADAVVGRAVLPADPTPIRAIPPSKILSKISYQLFESPATSRFSCRTFTKL